MISKKPHSAQPGKLPRDCTLLPLTDGELLVSCGHAVFCRVPAEETGVVRAVLARRKDAESLSRALLDDLERHGFFGPPREMRPDVPTVQLQLTNACNLECQYCCTNSGAPRADEVCFERMREVVRQVPAILGRSAQVAILGGEPLLVPWALDLADEVVALGLELTIFTNGIPLANDRTAQRIARLTQQGVKVRVSLAGPTVESCDTVSGGQRFQAALRGLRQLAVHGGHAAVDLMLVPMHVETIARDFPRLRGLVPTGMPVALDVLYMSGRETGTNLFGSRSDLEAALDRIAFEAGETIPATERSPVMDRREGCDCALGQHVHVRSDGALFNCFKMEEKVGDLEITGFAAAAACIRENPHPAVELSLCAECPLATLCGAGCRSENLLYTGDANVPFCGPWRVRVISELLAEDRVSAMEWQLPFLAAEARARGIETPELVPKVSSRHLIEV